MADDYGTTIGVYVPEGDEFVDEFDAVFAPEDADDGGMGLWPDGFEYHRSAATRALMRAAVMAAPELAAAGALPPDAADARTADDAERAVAAAFADVLAVGAAAFAAFDGRAERPADDPGTDGGSAGN